MFRFTAAAAVCLLVLSSAPAPAGQATQPAPRQPARGVLPPQPGGATTSPARPQPTPSTPATVGTTAAPAAPAPAAPATPVPQAVTASGAAPSEAELGAPVYPTATFIGRFDAGMGQRYFLFGTTATYSQVVAFYRGALKSRGEEVFDIPPIWSFEIGRFREQTMAYPPSVTVRDHAGGPGRGYLHAAGGPEGQRYPTVIQIVPPAPGEAQR